VITCLIDLKAAARCSDTRKARLHRSGDDYACHLDVAVNHDLLHVVAKVWHRGERVVPHLFLLLDAGGGKPQRRVDDHLRMKEVIERVQVARVSCCQPSEHSRLARVGHGTNLAGFGAVGDDYRSSSKAAIRLERAEGPIRLS
jgi:hypothetical protein